MTDRELVELAFSMREKAYAPYSKFPVGAALLCADGTIFTGCNVENAAFGSTICAERVAAVKAVTYGRRDDWQTLAIAGGGEDYCWPCGACLQVLREFCPNLTILAARGDHEFAKTTLAELLPRDFGAAAMEAPPQQEAQQPREPARTAQPEQGAQGEPGHFVLPDYFKEEFPFPPNDPAMQQFAKFFQDDWYPGDVGSPYEQAYE